MFIKTEVQMIKVLYYKSTLFFPPKLNPFLHGSLRTSNKRPNAKLILRGLKHLLLKNVSRKEKKEKYLDSYTRK